MAAKTRKVKRKPKTKGYSPSHPIRKKRGDDKRFVSGNPLEIALGLPPRVNQVWCVIGRRGSGKTWTTILDFIIPASKLGRKVAIMYKGEAQKDYQKKFAFETCPFPYFPHWCKKSDHIGPVFVPDRDTDLMIRKANEHFNCIKRRKGGLLVIDDFSVWHNGKMNDELKMLAVDTKQKNYDLLIQCHGLGDIPKSFFRYIDRYVVLKSLDNLADEKKRIPSYLFQKFDAAFIELEAYRVEDYHKVFIEA